MELWKLPEDADAVVFCGIRVFDAIASRFPVPVGSEPRPCYACRDDTFVQRSVLELMAKKRPRLYVLCYTCFRQMPREVRKRVGEQAFMAPEVAAEADMMKKSGKVWWENEE